MSARISAVTKDSTITRGPGSDRNVLSDQMGDSSEDARSSRSSARVRAGSEDCNPESQNEDGRRVRIADDSSDRSQGRTDAPISPSGETMQFVDSAFGSINIKSALLTGYAN